MAGFDKKENERTQRPLPPEGQHLALCYSIIDLGTQAKQYPGKPPTEAHDIQVAWELPKHRAVFNEEAGEQPMALFQTYTFSLSEKANFRKMMDSWTGKQVKSLSNETMKKFLGKPCMIQVVHKPSKDGKLKYANIALNGLAVYKRPADVPFPKTTENEQLFLSLDEFSWTTFEKITKYIQAIVERSKEWGSILRKFPEPGVAPQSTAVMEDQVGGISDNFEEEDPF